MDIGDLQIEGVIPRSLSPPPYAAMKHEDQAFDIPRDIVGFSELPESECNSSLWQTKRDRSSSLETELYPETSATTTRYPARKKRRARVTLTQEQQEGLIDLTGDD